MARHLLSLSLPRSVLFFLFHRRRNFYLMGRNYRYLQHRPGILEVRRAWRGDFTKALLVVAKAQPREPFRTAAQCQPRQGEAPPTSIPYRLESMPVEFGHDGPRSLRQGPRLGDGHRTPRTETVRAVSTNHSHWFVRRVTTTAVFGLRRLGKLVAPTGSPRYFDMPPRVPKKNRPAIHGQQQQRKNEIGKYFYKLSSCKSVPNGGLWFMRQQCFFLLASHAFLWPVSMEKVLSGSIPYVDTVFRHIIHADGPANNLLLPLSMMR